MGERWKPTDYSDLHKPTVLDKAREAADFFAEQFEKRDGLSESEARKFDGDLAKFASDVIDEVRVFSEVSTGYDDKLTELVASPTFQSMVTYRMLNEFLWGSTIAPQLHVGADFIDMGYRLSEVFTANKLPLPNKDELSTKGIMAFQNPTYQESLFETTMPPQDYMKMIRDFRNVQTKAALDRRQDKHVPTN